MTRSGPLVLASMGVVGVVAANAYAYRTAGDLPEFADTERVRWRERELHVERASWLPAGLTEAAVAGALDAALASWSAVDCADLAFVDEGTTTTVASPFDGRVTIQWIADGWTTQGFAADAAAATDVVYERIGEGSWHIADADIFLNAESHLWTTAGADPAARDLQAVLTHEVGHALGLLHPCEHDGIDGAPTCDDTFAGVAMHPEYDAGQRSLSADDEAGLCFLYQAVACETEGCDAGFLCTVDGCAASCDATTCAVGQRCGPFGCTAEPCGAGSCEQGCDDTCETPGGALWDPCLQDFECSSGVCSRMGACTVLCEENGSCPTGHLCDQSGERAECLPSDSVFGQRCSSGADCASNACLIEDGIPEICTRECGPGFRECPASYSCETVREVDVCVPPAGGGCSAAPGAPRGALAVVLAVGLMLLRRRPQC